MMSSCDLRMFLPTSASPFGSRATMLPSRSAIRIDCDERQPAFFEMLGQPLQIEPGEHDTAPPCRSDRRTVSAKWIIFSFVAGSTK